MLVGCGSNNKDRPNESQSDEDIRNAKELILGKWDEVPERPKENAFSRNEYTWDGKWRFWFLKNSQDGPKTLEGSEPGEPVNEGKYRFLDGKTITITSTNGDITSTDKFTIVSISKDKLVLLTEDKKKLVHTRTKQ